MGQHVTQLTPLVDGTGRLRGAVAADAAGEGELLEEAQKAFLVQALVWVDLRVGAFPVDRAQHARGAVAGPGHEDHVGVVVADHPVEMGGRRRTAPGSPPSAPANGS